MLKYILLCLGVLFALPAFATSGACSSHGGVDCNFQTQTGYAVCYDGAISSVLYSSMIECQASTPSCTAPTSGSLCSAPGDYNALTSNGYRTGAYRSGNWDQTLATCQTQINIYQAQESTYEACLNGVNTSQSHPVQVVKCPTNYYLDTAGNCDYSPAVAPIDYQALEAEQPAPTELTPEPVVTLSPVTPVAGKPTTPVKAPVVPKKTIAATSTVTMSTSTKATTSPSIVSVPIQTKPARRSLWYWVNPLHWF